MSPNARRMPLVMAAVLAAAGLLVLSCAASHPRDEMPADVMKEAEAEPLPSRAEAAAPSPVTEAKSSPGADSGSEAGEEASAERRLSTLAASVVKPPELLARIGKPDLEPLPPVSQDVTVVVVGHRARVVLDLVYHNPSTSTVAGTLMISLPDRASPCSLTMYQGDGVRGLSGSAEDPLTPALLNPTPRAPDSLLGSDVQLPASWSTPEKTVDWGKPRGAVVVEPVQGRQVYEAVTRARVDPALAEWSGSGSYSTRIFPIAAGALKRVVFAYDVTLVPSAGRILFPLPLPDGKAPLRRITVHDLSGATMEGSLTLNGKAVDSTRSAGSKVWQIVPEPSSAALYMATPRNPVVLSIAGVDQAIPGTLVSALITPELPRQSMMSTTGKALFLLDTSASGKEAMSALSAKMLRALLEGDDSLAEFALVCFDVRATLLTPGFVANTAEARKHYLGLVEQIWLEGATAFETALEYLEATPELGKADTVFLLSDGEITWGADAPAALARDHADMLAKRWICYSFGSTPHNRRLFDELARARGLTVQVGLGQDLAEAARAHRFPVYHLEGVRSILQDEVIVAGSPALLYPGQVLEVAIRMTRSAAEVRLVLRVDGKDHEVRVPTTRQAATDAMAARAWGELFTSSLLDDPDQGTERAILTLSQHFGLTNDYASFMILDTDEDYQRYGVSITPLDFRQLRQTLTARPSTRARDIVLSGLPVPEDLPEDAAAVLTSLVGLGTFPIWDCPTQADLPWAPKYILSKPATTPEAETPTGIYLAARKLMELSTTEAAASRARPSDATIKQDAELHAAHALRSLSTVAETKPRDDQALRLTGFVLMQWGFYDEAENLFSRVRSRRPFEPQNMLLEAMAQAAQGKAADAALRYEMVLHQTFPRFEDASRPVAARLYADILREAIRRNPEHEDAAIWKARLGTLQPDFGETTPRLRADEVPAGRLLLFWNIDDTDVDLHIREGALTQVWYQHKSSYSGGRLYWDNTEGLGPELYEHPRLSLRGFRVSVDYFASSSVEGAAPAATYVAAFTRVGRESRYRVGWHTTVLVGQQEDRVEIMPVWRR